MVAAPNIQSTETRSSVTWGVFFLFLYIYRAMYSVLGEVVVMRFTSIGDTRSYQSGSSPMSLLDMMTGGLAEAVGNLGVFQLSTNITDWIGSQFYWMFFGSPILINNGYQTITFVGLVYLLMSVPPGPRKFLAVLLMLPSFSLWTSIASKESIVSFCVAIISGYLVRQYTRGTKLKLIHISSMFLLYIFKPHYLIAVAYAWSAQTFSVYVKQKALLAYLGLLLSFTGLFLFRDKIDDLAFKVQWSFEVVTNVRSTRLEAFFVEKFDVFSKIPEGFFRAFVGPTLEEVATSPLHLVTFVESMVLVAALFLAVFRRFHEIPIYNFIVGIGVSFWIMFPNYPFGVMNAGSAIRYRSGWIILLFVAITVLMSRELFMSWRAQQLSRQQRTGKNRMMRVPAE
jgi:hypothetical protein